MKAVLVRRPGGPNVLEVCEIPDPICQPGYVLIRVRAFGLNRSELITRSTPSLEGIVFPRVLGIECVGEVVAAPGTEDLEVGQTVMALMGGMGKEIDGGYAELVSAPTASVIPVSTSLSWPELATIPMAYGTAWGSVVNTLGLRQSESILIRGATSSVGLAAMSIAKSLGATVVATTRDKDKRPDLITRGADFVAIDDGHIGSAIRRDLVEGADVGLELVGPPTSVDSSHALRQKGILCVSGFLAGSWNFEPLVGALGTIRMARFKSGVITRSTYGPALQRIVERVERGDYRTNLAKTFQLDEIAEAHRLMESNAARGKLVVVTP